MHMYVHYKINDLYCTHPFMAILSYVIINHQEDNKILILGAIILFGESIIKFLK